MQTNGWVHLRHHPKHDEVFLKIKGPPAQALFDAMVHPKVVTYGLKPTAQRRGGVHLLGSTQNLRDPVVVELRFLKSEAAVVAPSTDHKLYHGFWTRTQGMCVYAFSALRVFGEAGAALAQVLGRDGEEVVFRVVDPMLGEVELLVGDEAEA